MSLFVTSQGHGNDRTAVIVGRCALARCVQRVCLFPLSAFSSVSLCFFFLSVMSNVHAFLPAVTFCTQSWLLTWFVLLPNLSGFVPNDLFLCPLCSALSHCFIFTAVLVLLQVFSDCNNALCSRTRRQHILTELKPHFTFTFYNPLHFFHYKKHLCYSQSLNPSQGCWRLLACLLRLQILVCCYLKAWTQCLLQQLWERSSCWWKDLHLKTTYRLLALTQLTSPLLCTTAAVLQKLSQILRPFPQQSKQHEQICINVLWCGPLQWWRLMLDVSTQSQDSTDLKLVSLLCVISHI